MEEFEENNEEIRVLEENVPLENEFTEETQKSSKNKESHANQERKLLRLPLWKVKRIMKIDPDVQVVNKEAAFLVTKATELFIQYLTKSVHKHMDSKRKTIMKKDFDAAVNDEPNLCFLDGTMAHL
ncbi:DNA polymerase epsilon subunit 4 [Onthophagus taurus]|uniref:DNA polymerase epsilon subunit 4 n=1 Tax=Onthophagus taurus TaxID=166361 RepID=UPI000C203529|nr:DNA polymerase epsilon subunit 4 [Onthophagus taurus]